MVLRKAFDTVNKVGRAWTTLNYGNYSPVGTADRREESARILLEEVVADWPKDTPDTAAVTAARAYLGRTRGEG